MARAFTAPPEDRPQISRIFTERASDSRTNAAGKNEDAGNPKSEIRAEAE
jgi:hypothetical protein